MSWPWWVGAGFLKSNNMAELFAAFGLPVCVVLYCVWYFKPDQPTEKNI